MADDGEVDSEMFDISTLSESERRRLRRRQRILGNQGARLQRILKNDAESLKAGESSEGSAVQTESISRSDDVVDGATVKPKEVKKKDDPTPEESLRNRRSPSNGLDPSLTASLLQELSQVAGSHLSREPTTTTEERERPAETRFGVQSDGTVIMPKISEQWGHIFICVVGLFLSVCNAKSILYYFVLWEGVFYAINGLPPMPPANMAMVLAAVMGLRESQLSLIKKVIHFWSCVNIDFSLFLVFLLIPHVIKSLGIV